MIHLSTIRITVLSLLAIMSWQPLSSQLLHQRYSELRIDDEREAAEWIKQSIATDLATRQQPRQVLSTAQYLLDEENEQLWTNGLYLYQSVLDTEEHEVLLQPFRFDGDLEELKSVPMVKIKVKGKRLTAQGRPDVKMSVERIGGHIMLVGRNAQGVPVMALKHVKREQIDDNTWTLLAHYPIMGNYAIANKEGNPVFGPKMPFYSGDQYDTDPGILKGYHFSTDLQEMDIIYGDGRPSRGDPSNPKWGKMPGGGGAGALMGPMEWSLSHCVEGLKVIVRHDERFVNHEPAIGEEGDTVVLTKLQSPYEGLNGKWAFASVIPLTDALLMSYPREVLTLMRGEIYARHGDTFKDAATQRYFDAQPWYRRSNAKVIRLTEVEQFNYQLIKYIESKK